MDSKVLKDLAKILENRGLEVMVWDPKDMTEAEKIEFMAELERRKERNKLRNLGLLPEED